MKKLITGILTAALVAGLAGGGIYMKQKNSAKPVNVYPAENLITSYWEDENNSYGTVTTDQTQAVFLSDTLIVKEVKVEEGQAVKKGDVLMTYDTTLSQVHLDKKSLEIQQKELDLKKAQDDLAKIRTYKPGKSIPAKNLVSSMSTGLSGDTLLTVDSLRALTGLLTADLIPAGAEEGEASGEGQPESSSDKESSSQDESKETSTEEESSEEESSGEESKESPSETASREETTEESKETSSEEETTEEEPDDTVYPTLLAGRGTQGSPYVYQWNGSWDLNEKLMKNLAGKRTTAYVVLQLQLEPVGEGMDPTRRRIVLKPDAEKPELTYPEGSWWQLVIRRSAEGYTAVLKAFCVEGIVVDLQATEDVPLPEEPEVDPVYPGGSGISYTAEEITQMLAEAEEKVRDLDLDIRIAKVEFEKMRDELNNGSVVSEIDGVIRTVRDEETARLEGSALIDVSGGGGYYVKGTVSELDLEGIRAGMTVNVRSLENFMTYEGEVQEVSDYPASGGYYSGMGNYNVTYYEYTVFIGEDAELRENEYVSLSYQAVTDTGDTLYLENFMIRTENGSSYIYADNGEGRLEKREVRTGKSLWGSYTEIRSGLSREDRIAFPYGKDVKSGARCVEASMEDLYGGY